MFHLVQVQLLNFRAELETLLLEADSGPEACTDILVNNPDTGCVRPNKQANKQTNKPTLYTSTSC